MMQGEGGDCALPLLARIVCRLRVYVWTQRQHDVFFFFLLVMLFAFSSLEPLLSYFLLYGHVKRRTGFLGSFVEKKTQLVCALVAPPDATEQKWTKNHVGALFHCVMLLRRRWS